MNLHDHNLYFPLCDLRQRAATAHGRAFLQSLLSDYATHRGNLTDKARCRGDIRAARVRYALAEAKRQQTPPRGGGQPHTVAA